MTDPATGSRPLASVPLPTAGQPSGREHTAAPAGEDLCRPRISVALKLAVLIAAIVTLGMIALGGLIIQSQTHLLNRQMHTFGRLVAGQMAQSAKEPLLAGDILLLQVLTSNLKGTDGVLGTAIYNERSQMLTSAGFNPFQSNGPYAGRESDYLGDHLTTLRWRWQASGRDPMEGISFISPITFEGIIAGHALISFSLETTQAAIQESIRSIMAVTVTLILFGGIVSWFMGKRISRPISVLVDASRAIGDGRFDVQMSNRRQDEIGHLMRAFNSMARGLLEKAQVEQALSRYVGPEVSRQILDNLDKVEIGGQPVEASVLFVDIVGFTAKAENMSPEEVAELLNRFYANVSHAATLYNGSVDKYIGDGAMLVFGAPRRDDNHAFHAIACAVYLQHLARAVNERRLAEGRFPVFYRIGVNTGQVLAGSMGSKEHMQYTVVGDAVNLASRLCTAAGSDQIIITEEMYNQPGIPSKIAARPYQRIKVRGKSEPIDIWEVTDLREPYRTMMDQEITGWVEKELQA